MQTTFAWKKFLLWSLAIIIFFVLSLWTIIYLIVYNSLSNYAENIVHSLSPEADKYIKKINPYQKTCILENIPIKLNKKEFTLTGKIKEIKLQFDSLAQNRNQKRIPKLNIKEIYLKFSYHQKNWLRHLHGNLHKLCIDQLITEKIYIEIFDATDKKSKKIMEFNFENLTGAQIKVSQTDNLKKPKLTIDKILIPILIINTEHDKHQLKLTDSQITDLNFDKNKPILVLLQNLKANSKIFVNNSSKPITLSVKPYNQDQDCLWQVKGRFKELHDFSEFLSRQKKIAGQIEWQAQYYSAQNKINYALTVSQVKLTPANNADWSERITLQMINWLEGFSSDKTQLLTPEDYTNPLGKTLQKMLHQGMSPSMPGAFKKALGNIVNTK